VRDLFDDDAAEMMTMNHHHEAGRTDPGELPRLVRGSILIRNSIDTAGTPRHVDVVTLDDERGPRGGAASFVVEDNANMFHGLYRTSRENPIYLSDPEASPDDDEVRAAVVNSRTYLTAATTAAAAAGSRRDAAGGAAVIVDDFDRDVLISRATRPGTYTHTHTHTHSFNGPFSGTTQVSRHQKGKNQSGVLLKQETVSGSGISWAICKSAPRSRQITTPAPHRSLKFFTVRMPFLPPNQQRQSTEGISTEGIRIHSSFIAKFYYTDPTGQSPRTLSGRVRSGVSSGI